MFLYEDLINLYLVRARLAFLITEMDVHGSPRPDPSVVLVTTAPSQSVKIYEVRDLGLSLWRLQHLVQSLELQRLLNVLMVNKWASIS